MQASVLLVTDGVGGSPAGTAVAAEHLLGCRVLIVDDDPRLCALVTRMLGDAFGAVRTAGDGRGAVALASRFQPDLAICDLRLPDRCGVQVAAELRRVQPDVAILIMSGDDGPALPGSMAAGGGAFSFLAKPFTANELRINATNALLRRQLDLESAAYQARLRAAVQARTAELEQVVRRLRASQRATVRHLAKAVEMRDPSTGAHIDRIGELSALLAGGIGWCPEDVELLRLAAPMHDVGKIGIPDRILLKPGSLTPEERRQVERHPEIGHQILSGSDSALLDLAATIALTHHEWFDGSGYPRGLGGEEIPMAGRIVAVADVFDALTTDRVYRPALPVAEAVGIIREGRGTQFDPQLVDVLLERLDDALAFGVS